MHPKLPLETRLSLVGKAIDGLMDTLISQRARLDRVRENLEALHAETTAEAARSAISTKLSAEDEE